MFAPAGLLIALDCCRVGGDGAVMAGSLRHRGFGEVRQGARGPRPQAIDLECEGGACRHRGDTAAARQDPLEHPLDEPSRRRLAEHGSTHLVEKRFEAVKTFKLSNDPKFEEKFWDVIGLYLDPPTKALVLCCDEKSQCQALERTQLGLPLAPKRMRTMTHDYMRHGTVTLVCRSCPIDGHAHRGEPHARRMAALLEAD